MQPVTLVPDKPMKAKLSPSGLRTEFDLWRSADGAVLHATFDGDDGYDMTLAGKKAGKFSIGALNQALLIGLFATLPENHQQ